MTNNTEDVASALDDLIDESMDYERGNWTGFVQTPQEREDAMAQVSAHKTHVLDLIQQEANRQKLELLDRLERETKTLPTWGSTSMVEGFGVLSAIEAERKQLEKGDE